MATFQGFKIQTFQISVLLPGGSKRLQTPSLISRPEPLLPVTNMQVSFCTWEVAPGSWNEDGLCISPWMGSCLCLHCVSGGLCAWRAWIWGVIAASAGTQSFTASLARMSRIATLVYWTCLHHLLSNLQTLLEDLWSYAVKYTHPVLYLRKKFLSKNFIVLIVTPLIQIPVGISES